MNAPPLLQMAGSQRLLEKNGFVLEGTKRECRFEDNEWKNIMIYSMLGREYAQLRKKEEVG